MTIKAKIMEKAFCRPEGLIGHIGGRLMSFDRVLPAWVLDLLDLQPSDFLLEIGSGPGVGVELAALRANRGRVVGIDPSHTMLAMARRRTGAHIDTGCVDLRLGTIDDLPLNNETFDAAMSINNLHLWPDPLRGLRELARILRPQGRVAVAVSRFSYASADELEKQLTDSGFHNVGIHQSDRGTCALGHVGLRP